METVRLNQAIADFAMLTFENQEWFRNSVGGHDWASDLAEGTLTLGPRTFTIRSLGSHSEETDTWLWGWANRGVGLGTEHPTMAPVAALRERADQLGMPELTYDNPFPVRPYNDLGWLPGAGIASVAAHLIGATALYSGPYPGGRLWLAIMDGLPVKANPVKLARYSAMAFDAAQASPTRAADGVRHRQMIELYGIRRGLGVEATELAEPKNGKVQPGTALVWPGGSRVTFTYNEHGLSDYMRAELVKADIPERLPFEEDQDPADVPPAQG